MSGEAAPFQEKSFSDTPVLTVYREDSKIGFFDGRKEINSSTFSREMVPDCGCLLASGQHVLLGGEAAIVQCIPVVDDHLETTKGCSLELGMDDVSCMAPIPHSNPPAAVVGDDSGDLFRVSLSTAGVLSSEELPLPHTSGLASLVVMSCEPTETAMLITASYDCAVQAQLLPIGDEASAPGEPTPVWTAKVEALPPLDITDAAGRPMQSAGGVGSNPPFPHCAVELPGRRVALGCGDGTVRILSALDGQTLSLCVGVHTAGVACMDTVLGVDGGLLLLTGGLDGRVAAWRIEDDLQTAQAQEGQDDGAVDVLTSKDVAWVSRLPTDAITGRRWNANSVSARAEATESGAEQVLVSVAVAREAPEHAGHVVVYTLEVYNA